MKYPGRLGRKSKGTFNALMALRDPDAKYIDQRHLMRELMDHYGLSDYEALAYALACEHVPAFQIAGKRGAHAKDVIDRDLLYIAAKAVIEVGLAKNLKGACELLATCNRYMDNTHEQLREQLRAYTRAHLDKSLHEALKQFDYDGTWLGLLAALDRP